MLLTQLHEWSDHFPLFSFIIIHFAFIIIQWKKKMLKLLANDACYARVRQIREKKNPYIRNLVSTSCAHENH